MDKCLKCTCGVLVVDQFTHKLNYRCDVITCKNRQDIQEIKPNEVRLNRGGKINKEKLKMIAIVRYEKDGMVVRGSDLKIETDQATNQLKIYDGHRCIFYTELSKVHNAIIEPEII